MKLPVGLMKRFKGIYAQNFMSFKELIFPLDNQGIVAIEGVNKTNPCFISNGAGKSTPMEAFSWGVFGETIRELDSVDDVVNEIVGKDCSVYIPFVNDDGVNWEIKRHRNHHEFKNKVLLFREGEEWTKDVKIQDKINSLLGIDFKSFKSAFIFFNDGTKPFSACTDMEQKKLLEKLFDLEKYTALLEITKNKLKNINQKYADLSSKVSQDRIKLDVASKEISGLESLERTFTKDIKDKSDKLTCEILDLTRKDNSEVIFTLNQEIDNYRKELETLLHTNEIEGLSEQLELLRKELVGAMVGPDEDILPLKEKLDFYIQLASDDNSKISLKKRDLDDFSLMKRRYEKRINLTYPPESKECELQISILTKEIKDLCDQKTKFEKGLGGECSNCNQEITSEYKQKHVDEIASKIESKGHAILDYSTLKEKIENESVDRELKLIVESFQHVQFELDELNKLKAESDQKLNDVKLAMRVHESKREESQKKESLLRGQIDKQQSLIETKKTLKRKREDILKKYIEVNEDKLSSYEMEQSNNKLKIDMLVKQKEQVKNTPNPYTPMIKAKSEAGAVLFDSIEKDSQEEKDLLTKIRHYQFFETAFSRSGIQSYLLDNILPVLNKYAKHYASILSGGSLEVEFCNQSTSKSGETKEKFKVVVRNRDGGKSYKSDSCGEKRRVDLIALFALQKAAMLRSKSRFNVLFIDEIFDSLDPAGIENVIHILEDEVQSFPSIFLISHNPEIGGLLDSTITIKKENGFSSVVAL
jgi:DNA repair exonuclease SbcCD ATPase subunit